MATQELLNSISLCLNRVQAERNDRKMSRKQRHAIDALMSAWFNKFDPRSGDSIDYQRISDAEEAVRIFVQGEGRAMLKRMTIRTFVQYHNRMDWSWQAIVAMLEAFYLHYEATGELLSGSQISAIFSGGAGRRSAPTFTAAPPSPARSERPSQIEVMESGAKASAQEVANNFLASMGSMFD